MTMVLVVVIVVMMMITDRDSNILYDVDKNHGNVYDDSIDRSCS